MHMTVVGNEEIYGVEINNYQNVYLGSPFRVFTPEENDNYYFPLIEDDIIKCMLVVGKNEDGFSATLAKDFSEELNLLSTNTEYILYSNGNDIFAVNEDSCTLLKGNLQTENNIDFKFIYSNVLSEEDISFCNVYACQKANIIVSAIEQISEEKMNSLPIMASLAYTPSFQVNQTNWKLLAAMNYWELQKDDNGEFANLCWAATVATIANYRNGTHLRAYTIFYEGYQFRWKESLSRY